MVINHGDSVLHLTPSIHREIHLDWRENLNHVLDAREYDSEIWSGWPPNEHPIIKKRLTISIKWI